MNVTRTREKNLAWLYTSKTVVDLTAKNSFAIFQTGHFSIEDMACAGWPFDYEDDAILFSIRSHVRTTK